MKISILDRLTLGDDLDISIPFEAEVKSFDKTSADEEVMDNIGDADVVYVNKVKLNADNLSCAKNLKLICVAATGYDNIDLDYCRKNGIAVCNVPGYSTHSVAQVTVSQVLYLVNHMSEYTKFVSNGDYTKSGIQNCLTPVFCELYGKTWGVVGLGNIGTEVAKIAKAFGCRVLAYKRNPVKDWECVDLDTLIKNSDIITVHLPLTDDTKNIINSERINAMKKNAVFVNAARGAVCDEDALCKAVSEGRISGLGSDVYSKEPFGEDSPYHKIKDMENVCLTPHMAWGAFEARNRCFYEMTENTKAFFEGRIRNRVDL